MHKAVLLSVWAQTGLLRGHEKAMQVAQEVSDQSIICVKDILTVWFKNDGLLQGYLIQKEARRTT